MDRNGVLVEYRYRTLEQEVLDSIPTLAMQCPLSRHINSPYYWLHPRKGWLLPDITEKLMINSYKPVVLFVEHRQTGGPHGRVVKRADISLLHLTIQSSHRCVWCPALATCETSQVLLAGVSGGFSRGSPVFAPPTDWPVSYELK